ncbi:MAG: S8 family serine peptidase [Candidatus Dadabacteria bacterium]
MLEAALQYPALYVFWSGMSFSSPIVAGLAGLVWSANMSLTNAQVDQILRNTADNIGDPFLFGAGRVNANAASCSWRYTSTDSNTSPYATTCRRSGANGS